MEVDSDNPSEVNSRAINLILSANVLELSKKRKLQAEHLGLPSPKHSCLKATLGEDSDVSSHLESAKDSNSFAEDHSEYSPSCSSLGKLQEDSFHSSDATTLMKHEQSLSLEEFSDESDVGEKPVPEEYMSELNYACSEYETDHFVQYTEKEIEEILYSANDAKASTYVLSSGRWGVKDDDEQRASKPTIDQEFEQYFSMLML